MGYCRIICDRTEFSDCVQGFRMYTEAGCATVEARISLAVWGVLVFGIFHQKHVVEFAI